MPIAEAVLQQLICTGLADSHQDSETGDAPEDDAGKRWVLKTSRFKHMFLETEMC